MVDNSSIINKIKESWNSDGQQFYQYQQNKEKLNIDGQQFYQYQQNRESLKSSGLQFHQYQHSKRKFKQWWCTIRPISTNQDSLNSDGQ
jgi:hypothetical protein